MNAQVHAQAALHLGKNLRYLLNSKDRGSQVGLDALAERKMSAPAKNRTQRIEKSLAVNIDLFVCSIIANINTTMLSQTNSIFHYIDIFQKEREKEGRRLKTKR